MIHVGSDEYYTCSKRTNFSAFIPLDGTFHGSVMCTVSTCACKRFLISVDKLYHHVYAYLILDPFCPLPNCEADKVCVRQIIIYKKWPFT